MTKTIDPGFTIYYPVVYDKDELVLKDAQGNVLYNCGTWMMMDDEWKAHQRGKLLEQLLNGACFTKPVEGDEVLEFFDSEFYEFIQVSVKKQKEIEDARKQREVKQEGSLIDANSAVQHLPR